MVGAGACGLVASLTAAQRGVRVLLLEKGSQTGGNTALSAGLVIAAASRLQKAAGMKGTPEQLASDIFQKNGYQSDPEVTLTLCRQSGRLMDWLMDDVGVELELVADYKYPDHSDFWLHGPPARYGVPLVKQLEKALKKHNEIKLMVNTPVKSLMTDDQREIIGVLAEDSRGRALRVKTRQVILADGGFGGNSDMVRRYIPAMAEALYFGAPGDTGDGIRWGVELGAATEYMGAFQPHASVAYPAKVFVTSYIIMNGGIQVNRAGKRFGDETKGYAQHALDILQQPGKVVYEIFDERIYHKAETSYQRFHECADAGVIRWADTIEELATIFSLDATNLRTTIEDYNRAVERGQDEFGRTTFGQLLRPRFYGIQVTSALFHTQGGLKINDRAQVLGADGKPIPHVFAGGGTAVGISGSGPEGYLAGNGLLSALGLGKIAGEEATKGIVGAR